MTTRHMHIRMPTSDLDDEHGLRLSTADMYIKKYKSLYRWFMMSP